jgi:hypothetical protein
LAFPDAEHGEALFDERFVSEHQLRPALFDRPPIVVGPPAPERAILAAREGRIASVPPEREDPSHLEVMLHGEHPACRDIDRTPFARTLGGWRGA